MIHAFQGPYRFLSNFYPALISWRGKSWPSVEHAYQAAKILGRHDLNPEDEALVEQIRTAPTPGVAKRLGKQINHPPEWEDGEEEEPLKLTIMRDLVHLKFKIPDLRAQLLATEDACLIEGNTWGDKFWGVCKGEGANWLGKILMAERTQIRNAVEFPKPFCCEAIQKWPVVYARAAREEWEWDETEKKSVLKSRPAITWKFGLPSLETFGPFGYETKYEKAPVPVKCPFCGTDLPKFEERKMLPEPFCRSDDNYCLTCNERLMSCNCLVPELRWRTLP